MILDQNIYSFPNILPISTYSMLLKKRDFDIIDYDLKTDITIHIDSIKIVRLNIILNSILKEYLYKELEIV